LILLPVTATPSSQVNYLLMDCTATAPATALVML
jgi:hypothetical protein